MIWLVAATLFLAVIPSVLFMRNLSEYRTLAHADPKVIRPRLSVLIPARNEGDNIAACVRSVLRSQQVDPQHPPSPLHPSITMPAP